jgi:type 2 lantibiotic biosynthesis protein LanM
MAQNPGLSAAVSPLAKRQGAVRVQSSWIDRCAPIAFEEILIDDVARARARLLDIAGAAAASLEPTAWTPLLRALAIRLSETASATLVSEFGLYRSLSPMPPGSGAPTGNHHYRKFVSAMATGRRAEVLTAYPMLAELLRQLCDDWADAQAEMLSRLRDDWPAICEGLGWGAITCRIASIALYRSDPHHGGRAVALLGFGGGQVLAYKPRSVALDDGFGALLTWSSAAGFSEGFRRPWILVRPGYGWMEFIAAAPCVSQRAIARYFHRVGGLIGLVTLLQGNDIHRENLIAAGDQPVIIDAETLLHPLITMEFSRTLGAGAARRCGQGDDFAALLADSGFLATPGQPDFSALGSGDAVRTPFRQARSVAANTDAMAREDAPFEAPSCNNLPVLAGIAQQPRNHIAGIVAGYAEIFELSVRHRKSLLAAVAAMGGCDTRVVFRSTNAYGLLLNASTRPAMLTDRPARAAQFAALLPEPTQMTDDPALSTVRSAIVAEEQAALMNHDIPHITRPCATQCAAWRSPLDQVLERITGRNPSDLAAHIEVLRAGLERTATGQQRDLTRCAALVMEDDR